MQAYIEVEKSLQMEKELEIQKNAEGPKRRKNRRRRRDKDEKQGQTTDNSARDLESYEPIQIGDRESQEMQDIIMTYD